MTAPIGGRLQPSREAVESLLRSRKSTLKAVGSTKETKVKLREPRLQGYVAKRAPMDHEPSGFARYGDGSAKGKRLPDEFSKGLGLPKAKKAMDLRHGYTDPLANLRLPSKTVPGEASRGQLPPKKHIAVPRAYPKGISNVGKRVRNKDAEDDRQRRMGMGVAAAGLGGGLLLRRGVGGAIKTTRNLRGLGLQPHEAAWKTTPSEVKQLMHHYVNDKPVRGKGVAMTSRQALETAGGGALVGGALGLDHYSRTERNMRWEPR